MIGPGQRLLEVADGWIAVSATTSEQVKALCAATGADDPEGLPAAVSTRSKSEALTALGAAGVPAAEVRQGQKGPFFDDPDHQQAGLIATYRHLEWGTLEQPGAMWWFPDQDVKLDRAPPVLGQHTIEVLSEMGWTQPEIDHLLETGVVIAHTHTN